MIKFANFVRATLVSGINQTATTIRVQFSSPFQSPVDPAGQISYCTLADNINLPTKFEIISYTTLTPVSSGVVDLSGVTRGVEGTAANDWDAGDYLSQDITAATLRLLELQQQRVFIYGCSVDTTVKKITPEGDVSVYTFDGHDDDIIKVSATTDGGSISLGFDGKLRRCDSNGISVWSISAVVNPNQIPRHYLVTDKYNNSYYSNGSDNDIRKVDPDGNVLWTFTGHTDLPRGLAVDNDGFVYSTDEDNVLKKISPDGYEVWSITPGFFAPSGLSVNNSGNVYVSDVSKIYTFDSDGNAISNFTTTSFPLYVKADDQGNIYYCQDLNSVIKATSAGTQIWIYEDISLSINDIEIDYTNRVYLCSGRKIVALDAAGNYDWEYDEFQSSVYGIAVSKLYNGMLVRSDSSGFSLGNLLYSEIINKPSSDSSLVLREVPVEPSTPPAGYCVVYLNSSGELKVKFDNGTTDIIASK